MIKLMMAMTKNKFHSNYSDSSAKADKHPRRSMHNENVVANDFSLFGNQAWDIFTIILSWTEKPNELKIRDVKRIQK